MNFQDILKRPIVTEKSTSMIPRGIYTFEVNRQAVKKEIVEAVEKTFNVHVRNIRIVIQKGKTRRVWRRQTETRHPDWKKAIVQLAEGEKIDTFETGE